MFFLQKIGIIQAVLQTLNGKFQNKKIVTTIYSMCCVCVFWSTGCAVLTELVGGGVPT